MNFPVEDGTLLDQQAAVLDNSATESRLNQLDPNVLIPNGLLEALGIEGPVNCIYRFSDKDGIEFVIADEERMTVSQIEEKFDFLDEYRMPHYHELDRGGGDYARPLVYGSFVDLSSEMLFGGLLELHKDFQGRGGGSILIQNIENVARSLGFRFYTGYQNDAKTVHFFLKDGGYLIEEVKDELKGEFQALWDQEEDKWVFFTIKFLNPDDVLHYIKPERIGTSVAEKIEFKRQCLEEMGIADWVLD